MAKTNASRNHITEGEAVLALAQTHASTDKTRASLLYVRVDADRVWSTDGHRAVILNGAGGLPEGAYLGGVRVAVAPAGPEMARVTPPESTPIAVTLTTGVIEAIRAIVAGAATKTTITAHFKPDGTTIHITAHTPRGMGDMKAVVTLTPGPCCRAPLRGLGINARYLVDAIAAIGAGARDLSLLAEDASAPVRMDGPRGMAIVMPMRI